MSGNFSLQIDTDRVSLTNPYAEDRPSEETMEKNRRKGVANLLRAVALMLEQGRDVEKIRDHNRNVCGMYTLRHY